MLTTSLLMARTKACPNGGFESKGLLLSKLHVPAPRNSRRGRDEVMNRELNFLCFGPHEGLKYLHVLDCLAHYSIP